MLYIVVVLLFVMLTNGKCFSKIIIRLNETRLNEEFINILSMSNIQKFLRFHAALNS